MVKGRQESMGLISSRRREASSGPKLYSPAYELSYTTMLQQQLPQKNASAGESKAGAVSLDILPKSYKVRFLATWQLFKKSCFEKWRLPELPRYEQTWRSPKITIRPMF